MKRKFRCKNVGNYNTLTIGKIYEGTLDEGSGLVTIKTDRGCHERIYATRFDEVTDKNAVLKVLESELVVLQTLTKEKQDEIDEVRKEITPTRGSRWVVVGDNPNINTYIVADTGAEGYALISLQSGARWADPVKDITKIFGNYYKFVKVN